ncbi:hypothetical protein SERLA73DRAFT_181375 [Serpula lacrymans var. lacrymans S7.3]|uniref:Palmitoyltransferase n=1 Tax=Serpula lacrymans var. lacrymans (strain S7.3) TaxID=936435 RepID=F8PXY5_SERL3|nr:hypothetical protein SERLA73DRAFT_181375 [Serpula lacrymans var. lacrymans S7.3]
MICARTIFRCFRWLERMGDRVTGAAGPFFVGLAVILISLGTVCFFDVIQPTLRFPWLTTPPCILIVCNLFMHYYYVCTIPPGFIQDGPREAKGGILWAGEKPNSSEQRRGVRWSGEDGLGSGIKISKANLTMCKKCGQTRPERSHHCRICKRCVLKYDHHCPGVNQCVGLHNERHFVMFMAYLVISTFCYSVLGYQKMLGALGLTFMFDWPYLVPSLAYILIYMLSVVLCLAVGIMLSWHLLGVAAAETSVESQDHDVYRKIAKSRNDTFVNSYDLGKRKNLELFFNIGPTGYPWYTLILPLRIMPYTDGRSWARREGFERHRGVREGEELTDEDDDEHAP